MSYPTVLDSPDDVYITATARTEQLLVLTANVADFERLDNVAVVGQTAY